MRVGGTLWTYATRVQIGKRRTMLALIAGGSLTHKIAKAVFQGLFGAPQPFYRTPKMDTAAPLLRALAAVLEEIGFAVALIAFSVEILRASDFINNQAVLWSVMLAVQSLPYLAAIITSLISGMGRARYKRLPTALGTLDQASLLGGNKPV